MTHFTDFLALLKVWYGVRESMGWLSRCYVGVAACIGHAFILASTCQLGSLAPNSSRNNSAYRYMIIYLSTNTHLPHEDTNYTRG